MKKLLFIFTVLFTFSTFADATSYRRVVSKKPYLGSWSCVSVGDVVPTRFMCDATHKSRSGFEVVISSSGVTRAYHPNQANKTYTIASPFTSTPVSGCPVGKVPNEITGICEEPPEDFCGSSEFLGISASEGNACAARYPNHLTDFSSQCTDRNNYSFTCNQGIEKPPVTDPDPTDPDPTDPDPTDPDPDNGNGETPDPDNGNGETPDPDNGNGETPDPDNGNGETPDPDNGNGGNIPSNGGKPTYSNGGNNSGSGSSGGTASSGDLSVNINFDGVHNRLDAANKNIAATNERIETTNEILNKFANDSGVVSGKTNQLLGDLKGSIGGLGDKLDDIANGSNTEIGNNNCASQTFTCSGNAYECFVARQAWKNACLMESLNGDDLVPREGVPVESSQQVSESGDALITDLKNYSNSVDKDDLSNGEIVISDALNEFDESNGLSFDEKCPAPHVVDTGVGLMTIDYTPFCDLALYVRAMLMLFASIGSILMIAKFS